MRRSVLMVLVLCGGCGRNFTPPGTDTPPKVLTASAGQPDVAPGGKTVVNAVGGVPPYRFALVAQSGSDATIDTASGAYQAGSNDDDPTHPHSAIDTVSVTDQSSQTAQVNISVGPPLRINPSDPALSVVSGHDLTFVATGGQPPYTFSFVRGGNSSWGVMQPFGVYTAGPNAGGEDLVQVTDSIGRATQRATVRVTPEQLAQVGADAHLLRGDFNGDLTGDLLVWSPSGQLTFVLGRVGPTAVSQPLSFPRLAADPLIGDFNGDGCDDVLLQFFGGHSLLLHGQPSGTPLVGPEFEMRSTASPIDLLAQGPVLTTMDLRPAMPQVLLAGVIANGTVGDGGFTFGSRLALLAEVDGGALTPGAIGATPFDSVLNQDLPLLGGLTISHAIARGGSLEVVDFANGPQVRWDVASEGGLHTLDASTIAASGPFFLWPGSPCDPDGDGRLDVCETKLIGGLPNVLAFMRGLEDGGLDSLPQVLGAGVSAWTEVPADAHLNDHDYLLVLAADGGTRVDPADGGGSPVSNAVALPPGAVDMAVTDLDADGLPDLIQIDEAGQLHVYPADALGAWASPRRFRVQHQQFGEAAPLLAVGDLDGDGRAEVLAANPVPTVLEGTPDGRLSSEVVLGDDGNALALAIVRGAAFALTVLPGGSPALRVVRPGANGAFSASSAESPPVFFGVDRAYPLRAAVPAVLAHLVNAQLDANHRLYHAALSVGASGAVQYTVLDWPEGVVVPISITDGGTQDLAFQSVDDLAALDYVIQLRPATGALAWSETASRTIGTADLGLDAGFSLVGSLPSVVGGPVDTLVISYHPPDEPDGRVIGYDVATGATELIVPSAATVDLSSGSPAPPLATCDLDGDGLTDVVWFSGAKLSLALRRADGFHVVQPRVDLSGRFSQNPLLGCGNIDGAGGDDLVIYETYPDSTEGTLSVYLTTALPDGGLELR